MCGAGETLSGICDTLNAEGLAPPRGSQWNVSWVDKLVKNPAYKGDLRQHNEGVEYRLAVPAIVDETTWDAAQAGLASRHRVPLRKQYTVPALCRTLVHCGVCDDRMRVLAGNFGMDLPPGKKRTYTRYFCPTCKGLPYHRADKVDDEVWHQVKGSIIHADDLIRVAATLPAGDDGAPEAEVREAAATLARIDRKAKEVTAQFTADRLTMHQYEDALSLLKTQREQAERRMATARRAIEVANQARTQRATLAEVMTGLRARIASADEATRRKIVEAIVPLGTGQIRLHPDHRIEIRGVMPMESVAPAGADAAPPSPPPGGAPGVSELSTESADPRYIRGTRGVSQADATLIITVERR
jgi:hypothetical protein